VETIITEIAQSFIKNIVEIISVGGKISEIEESALQEAKSCTAQMMSVYAESVDRALVTDKAARRETGYRVERRGDERRVQTLVGEISYRRTYFEKVSGGYEYLTDTALGVDKGERVSEGLSLSLVRAAKDMSYGKASKHISLGAISRQTVMGKVRKSYAVESKPEKLVRVPELHIDADEAHITLCGGKKSEVPLISVYEGIEKHGKRKYCKNVFHISEYGKKSDDLWEQALTEIEARYDLTSTKIYLHGDGANWVQAGLEWFSGAIFVLDKYHKNKAIKGMTAGLLQADRKLYDKEIRGALAIEDTEFFDQLTESLCWQLPERVDKIIENARYLKRFVAGISICEKDPAANNGGCTEPHVSHVLSARLSSRPMAWSRRTLKKLAPILAKGEAIFQAKQEISELPKPLRNAAVSASKAFRKGVLGLPSPNAIGTLPLSGKVTGTQKILKLFA
jgi:hypothetical protein